MQIFAPFVTILCFKMGPGALKVNSFWTVVTCFGVLHK